MNKEKYEIIKFEDGDFILDVNVSQNEDTVWLTQAQIAKLYDRARNTINEDINNIFKENELFEHSVCRKNRQSALDGKTYETKLYNIDSSIKDTGKKISHISKLETINILELLQKYIV